MLEFVRRSGFTGAVYPLNPRYESIEDLDCYPALSALPAAPDLVVLAVADQRLETALIDAIGAGARAAVIFGGANLADDTAPLLPARLADIAREAALPVCGIAGMGYVNPDHRLNVSFSLPPYDPQAGPITLLSHSGSSWSSLTLNDGRLGFNLSVSAGQELTVTVAEYLDYALDLDTTRVVGLVLETVRDPEAFLEAAEKANERAIPLVALKAGRTPAAARLAQSHSGAIAGNEAAFEAIFHRYGVSRVSTLDEMAATLLLLSQERRPGEGALGSIHDSGFERELIVDLAAETGVAFAPINSATESRLQDLLDPGLPAVNPLDVWGTGHDHERVFIESFCALLDDPGVALGFVCHSSRDGAPISDAWTRTLVEAHRRQHKPVALVTAFSGTRHADHAERLRRAGIAVIEGMHCGLLAAHHAFTQRDHLTRAPVGEAAPVEVAVRERWQQRLESGANLDEAGALELLADYGVVTVPHRIVHSAEEAVEAMNGFGAAVALKTAVADIHHKTEVDGVRLHLDSERTVIEAYEDLAARLGPRVLVSAMASPGIEMSLGMITDPQFGPLVLVAAGGTDIELDPDCALALPPFGDGYARALIGRLRCFPRLQARRGRAASDVAALAAAASRLSRLTQDLGNIITEIDINPMIVNETGAIAVDALVMTRGAPGDPGGPTHNDQQHDQRGSP
jgi:acyl-CoA synthetase (NDP forming)